MEASASKLNGTLEGLVDSLSDPLKWEWDDRFGGVLAVFEVADKDRVFGVINTHFSQAWDSACISDAPDSVSGALQNFGGLTTNQLLFRY